IHDESSGSGCAKWRQARNRSLKHQWSSTGVRSRARRLRQSNCYYTGERLRETFALLKQFNTGNDPVLTTRRGGEWAFRRLRADGTLWRNDNVAPLFRRVLKACKLLGKGLSHYNLRKTSATLLESHSEYGRYVTYFLGHSPKGTAAKHYAAPSTELFDAAVTWLGRQYGL